MNFLKKMLGLKVTVERTYQISRVVNGDDFSGFGAYEFSYYEDPENPIDFQKICDVYYKHFFLLMPSENAGDIITKKGSPDRSDEDLMTSSDDTYFIRFQISLKQSNSTYQPFYHIIYYSSIKGEYSTNVIKSIYNALDELKTISELGHQEGSK
ncbi:MAG: hypothetical protein WD512_13065 [Candidatus Paceibacterota bacterium]